MGADGRTMSRVGFLWVLWKQEDLLSDHSLGNSEGSEGVCVTFLRCDLYVWGLFNWVTVKAF